MKVKDALICLECDEVYLHDVCFSASQVCPSCSSKTHIRLARFFKPMDGSSGEYQHSLKDKPLTVLNGQN